MKDEEKDRDQLVKEVKALRRRLAELKTRANSERTPAKDLLHIEEDKYPVILENMGEAYFEIDLAGNFTFFNRATTEMLGYSADEISRMNYRSYAHPKTAARLFKIFNKIYRTGDPAKIVDYEVIKKDGSRQFREMSASLIRDSQGNPIGFRGVARDVTKRKLAEKALHEKDQELQHKSVSLAESNSALKVLLKQREDDKIELERNVLSNIGEIVLPYLQELKKRPTSSADQNILIDIIGTNLNEIASPFLRNITLKHFSLTPKEFQVANLVKEGKTTKEISKLLNMSTGVIDFHRNSMRRKFGLNNKKVNLRSYLLSLA